jgi:excisionase family DNA binding protein
MRTPPHHAPRALPDDMMIVTLTVGDLRALVRAEATAVLKAGAEPLRPQWVDVAAAAKHAGAHPKTIKRWIAAGLPATRLGRDYRLRIDDLDAWLEQHLLTRRKEISRA